MRVPSALEGPLLLQEKIGGSDMLLKLYTWTPRVAKHSSYVDEQDRAVSDLKGENKTTPL